MSFPTPYTVQTRKKLDGPDKDNRGRDVRAWAPPVDQHVMGWSAPQSSEPKLAGHERLVVELELLTPPGFDVGPHDRVSIPGAGEFFAVGYPEDFTHGPWGFSPGYVVNLVRAEG